MRNLILLFIRYGGFLTFLLLEVLSFTLIVQFNQEQSRIFVHSINQFTGKIDKQRTDIKEFFQLRSALDSIAEENARLKSIIGITRFDPPITEDSIAKIADSLLYRYRSARVIKNSYSLTNNYLTLNKGLDQGIIPRMGVIGENGIVGIVRNVSKNYALVMSVLHQQMRVSVSLKKSGYFGSLSWRGGDANNFFIEDIPRNAQPEKGDTIITNGYSTHFPPDIPVGIIDTAFAEAGSSFFSAKVKMLQDPGNIRDVYVVEKQAKKEQLELERSVYD